jgi:beta-glucosidase
MHTIAQPIDSLGLNYYTRGHVRFDASLPYPHAREVEVPGAAYTTMGWEIFPEGLHHMLVRLQQQYPVKDLFIAENGAALNDQLLDGQINDPVREQYLHSHLMAVAQAKREGVPLSAYFAWSLMDNFEWGKGYTQRFGLCHVDYTTQVRTPKASAWWYQGFIASQQIFQ